ncbi:AzlD domain-containing protein [Halostreptopolyspora alba]|uniref:AzlD domain-containing protein n=1 Tax=Halostreptopolyspora alba TaxID=2487137 RepID=A0A3N0E919_9ACTN|nr:AzlD domain-containing protein [Nocardiopsaceae bacterium YIM 96095]
MNDPLVLAAAVAVLAGATFALRAAGPLLRSRVTVPARLERLMETSAAVLLVAVVATTALTEDQGFAGVARPAGVLAGGVLAWRGAPFAVVVLTAAGIAAGLRLLGVP